VERAEPSGTNGGNARDDSPAGEPSVSSSLEHLVAGGQGVITKRIDLALLEGQELLSRSSQRAALVGTGMILGAGLALLFAPKAGHEIRHDIAEKVGEIGEHLRAQAPAPAAPANGPSA
jgi:hypothetical protein